MTAGVDPSQLAVPAESGNACGHRYRLHPADIGEAVDGVPEAFQLALVYGRQECGGAASIAIFVASSVLPGPPRI